MSQLGLKKTNCGAFPLFGLFPLKIIRNANCLDYIIKRETIQTLVSKTGEIQINLAIRHPLTTRSRSLTWQQSDQVFMRSLTLVYLKHDLSRSGPF